MALLGLRSKKEGDIFINPLEAKIAFDSILSKGCQVVVEVRCHFSRLEESKNIEIPLVEKDWLKNTVYRI